MMMRARKRERIDRRFDIDEMLNTLLDEVRTWYRNGDDTDQDGFEQLRIRFYNALGVPVQCPALIDRDENPGRAVCQFCGQIHE